MDTPCDICGFASVHEIKCKLVCGNCGTILRSCADLAAGAPPAPAPAR